MTLMERPYLSIGEVLGLLLEEFPDVTISKIRFLESQGLIDPERTPSGYRKFYEVDVERLRVILREQRENFLPLRVIRDRLENGQIDESGSLTPPRGARLPVEQPSEPPSESATDAAPEPSAGTATAAAERAVPTAPAADLRLERDPTPVAAMAPLELSDRSALSADELCAAAGLSTEQLTALGSFGIIANRPAGGSYSTVEVQIARAAAGFLQLGIEARHLRGWRQAVDRESALFEQVVLPYLRQRNPSSRRQAVDMLESLAQLGGELRASLLHAALQHHLDS